MKEVVIQKTVHNRLDLNELYQERRLLYYFIWRELKSRYKQTVVGVFWVILQPLFLVSIFSLFISQLGRDSAYGVPYFIFAYTGILFWGLFSSIVNRVSNSIVTNGSVIRKIYFPRIILPLSGVAVAFVDFVATALIFLLLIAVFQIEVHLLGFLLFIPMILLTVMAALGIGLLFAAINVKYRDIKHALPFTIQAWFFLTPIIYPIDVIPDEVKDFVFLNPMTGVTALLRVELFAPGEPFPWYWIATSMGSALLMFVVGLRYYLKRETTFPEQL